MTTPKLKLLIYGYGNPGRQDDGLGIMLAEQIEAWAKEKNLYHVSTDSNYQLNLEDAATISNYDVVIFADASGEKIDTCLLVPLAPSASVEFTMHAVSPSFILHLCQQVFEKTPEAWLLHIKGYEWEFLKEMTPRANDNLQEAVICVQKFIEKKSPF